MGGSLGVVIPKAVSELVGLADGSEVSLSVVGRQIVIEPTDDTIPDETYRRSLGAVLRRYGPAFEGLAKFDAGKAPRRKRPRPGATRGVGTAVKVSRASTPPSKR